jgi:protocatechuate 3,4-dioxygenase beta subunit
VAIIRGKVTDPKGRPVAEAAVYIVSSPRRMPDIAQLTDEHGQFIISAPVPGRYRVGVNSDSWGLTQTDVEVSDQNPVIVEVQFTQPTEVQK